MHGKQKSSLPVIVICGPTAVGKTQIALLLSQRLNGEIISADSRQLYKYLSIGTGKDIPPSSFFLDKTSFFYNKNPGFSLGYYLIKKTPLWLYDMIYPDQTFSPYQYALAARKVIAYILQRGKIPIVEGGSGLYIKALIDGLSPSPPPNKNLRNSLSSLSVEKLQKIACRDAFSMYKQLNWSDKNNPRRLIRLLEKQYAKEKNTKIKKLSPLNHTVYFVGIRKRLSELYNIIDMRVEQRIKSGFLNEISSLLAMGYTWKDPGLSTIGYKQIKDYFEKKISLNIACQKWKFAEHAYARRQITWFKKDSRIVWYDNKKNVIHYISSCIL